MQGAFSPSETDQAHIVKETQRDAATLAGSVCRSTPSTSASALIEALVAAMRNELQARPNEGNQTMQPFDATGLDSRFKSFGSRALSLWTGYKVISSK